MERLDFPGSFALAALMEKLLPDAHIDSWFLTAKTDDYVRWKEVKERYLK